MPKTRVAAVGFFYEIWFFKEDLVVWLKVAVKPWNQFFHKFVKKNCVKSSRKSWNCVWKAVVNHDKIDLRVLILEYECFWSVVGRRIVCFIWRSTFVGKKKFFHRDGGLSKIGLNFRLAPPPPTPVTRCYWRNIFVIGRKMCMKTKFFFENVSKMWGFLWIFFS